MKARPCGQNISNSKAQVKVAGGVTQHNEVYIYRLQKVQKKKNVGVLLGKDVKLKRDEKC